MTNINNETPVNTNYETDKESKTDKTNNPKIEEIKKGFSNKNSYSSKEKKSNSLLNDITNKPKIDAPDLSPIQMEKGMEETMSVFSSLSEGDKEIKKNLLKTDKNELEKKIIGLNTKKKIKGGLEVLEKNKSLQNVEKNHDKINEKIENKLQNNNNQKDTDKKELDKMEQLSNTFFEVTNKLSRIKSAPKDVLDKITNDINKLVKDLADGKELDVDTAILKLTTLKTKLTDSRIILEQETIRTQQTERERLAKDEMKNILESIEKSKEAKKSGGIGKILGYIGAGLMVVVAAVMIAGAVFTGGASAIAAAALIVTATSLMITMQVSQETGGWMTKMFGEDNQLAATIFLTAVIFVLSLGAGIASGVGAAGATANAAAKFTAITDKITKGAYLASSATQMAAATSDGISAHQKYEATNLSADAKEARAKWLRVQLFIDENMNLLIKAIKNMHLPIQDLITAYKTSAKSKSEVLRNFS